MLMRVLAIDTSLGRASACVLENEAEEPIAEEFVSFERGHSDVLIPLLDRVVTRVAGGLASIDRVAVTVGPGSFTGIRVGISAAKAIALSCSIPLVGVSTLAAFAAPLILAGVDGIVAAAMFARNKQVYIAAFGQGGCSLFEPRTDDPHAARRSLGAGPIHLIGPAADLLCEDRTMRDPTISSCICEIAPRISFVARLGLVADPRTAPANPLYITAPYTKTNAA